MTSQIKGFRSIRNANDAISMISTADGALVEVGNMLQRMRELAVQSANGTTTADDRDYLSKDTQISWLKLFHCHKHAVEWRGYHRRNSKRDEQSVAYQVGANGGQTVSVNFGNFTQSAVGGNSGV